MPFYDDPNREHDQNHEEMVRLLVEEIGQGRAGTGPQIIQQQVQGSDRLHVYVIWDRWPGVLEEHRSAAILDAYREHFGESTMSRVSIAMGLTPAEAEAMGITAPK